MGCALLLLEVLVLLALSDIHLEWTILNFYGPFAFTYENVHHEVADAFGVDFEFDQAVVALGNQRL